MHRLPALWLAALALAPACNPGSSDAAAAQAPAGLVIVAGGTEDRPYFHDFGFVEWGQTLEHTFELVNHDPEPVTIRDLIPSCGCAQPRIYMLDEDGNRIEGNTRDKGNVLVVPPGRGCFIDMRLDTRQVRTPNRDKLAQVRLRSNSKTNAFLSFEMHVVVQLLFQATPPRIDFGRVGRSVGGTAFTEIVVAVPDSTAEPLDVKSHDPLLEVELIESIRFGNRLWTLTARFPAEQPLGPHLSTIVLRTTDRDGEGTNGEFHVDVSGQVVEDITATPPILALGSFPRGEGASIETTLKSMIPGHRVEILDFEIQGDGADEVKVEFRPVSPDDANRSDEWIVSLAIAPQATLDAYAGRVTLKLDDETFPTIELPFSGRVN